MSAGKLDQSLDEIMKDSKTARGPRPGRRQPRRAAKPKAAAPAAPIGGVKKNRKDTKATTAPAVVAPKTGESKIIVSGLPDDVNETQIKDYFGKTIGPVKRVQLQYGPNGRSRGSANITFSKPDSAAKAAKDLNGIKVDNRTMRIEVIMGASAIAPAPAPKTLGERVSQPKSAAKEKTRGAAAAAGNAKKAVANGTEKGKPKKKAPRAGRTKKTSQELDQEMNDYFGSNEGANGGATNGAAVNGAAAPAAATNGDAGMEDEVM